MKNTKDTKTHEKSSNSTRSIKYYGNSMNDKDHVDNSFGLFDIGVVR